MLQPCFVQPDNLTVVYNIASLFPNIKTSKKITISGGFLFQGYNTVQHCIFSIHTNDQIVVALKYQISSKNYILIVNGISNIIRFIIMNVNIWYFLILDVQILSDNSIQCQISLLYSGILLQSAPLPFNNIFNLEELELSIGNPPQRFNIEPSCSLIKNVSIFIDSEFYGDSFFNVGDYVLQNESKLLYHYDSFYSLQNKNYLINDQGFFQQKINQIFQINNSFQLNQGDQLQTNDIDLDGDNGIILSFYVKFISSPALLCTLINIFISTYQINISVLNTTIKMDTQFVQVADIQQWHNFLIIITNQPQQAVSVIVDGQQSQMMSFQFGLTVRKFQVQFSPNSSSYLINHIRIYQGTALSTEGNCQLQSMNLNKSSCILCNAGYILDFQNEMKCVQKSSTNTDNHITGVKDWYGERKVCPPNMINYQDNTLASDTTTDQGGNTISECKCIIGYYKQDNQCLKCPKNCIFCTSLADCNQLRDINGKCLNNRFDDGQSCIQPLFLIPLRKNFVKVFEKPDFGNQCTVMDPDNSNFLFSFSLFDFKWGDSFFFSYSLNFNSYLGGFNTLKVAQITENSIEVFNITILENYLDSQPLFQLIFNIKNTIIKRFVFNPNDIIWIGFWTDNKKQIFLIRTNRYNYQDQSDNMEIFSSINLQVCIGRCDTLISGCISVKDSQFNFIRNIPYPTEQGIKGMFSLMYPDVEQIGKYQYSKEQTDFKMRAINLIGAYSNQILQYSRQLQLYNNVQGIGLNQSIYGILTFRQNNMNGLLTFHCNIQFDNNNNNIQKDYLFLSLMFLDYNKFIIYFITDQTLQIVRLRICFLDSCQYSKYAFLNLVEFNFFLLYSKILQKWERVRFQQYFEVEVVCNYMRETFYFNGGIQSVQIIDFSIGASVENHLFYIDNINLYQEYGFIYFEYSDSDPCFIYINKKDMKCVELKEDFLYYNNEIIRKEDCINLSIKLKQITVINRKGQTCDVKFNYSYEDTLCQIGEYISQDFVCTQCRDYYSDPVKKCLSCKSHYYLNPISNLCQECDPNCKECSGNQSNCTDCYFSDQSPPSCNCLLSSHYLDINFQCQPCSYKCGSCLGNPNQCITCSQNGRILPLCDCNDSYQEIDYSCQQIKCHPRCSTCTSSPNNCTECSFNRVNPPLCTCAEGYQDNSQGYQGKYIYQEILNINSDQLNSNSERSYGYKTKQKKYLNNLNDFQVLYKGFEDSSNRYQDQSKKNTYQDSPKGFQDSFNSYQDQSNVNQDKANGKENKQKIYQGQSKGYQDKLIFNQDKSYGDQEITNMSGKSYYNKQVSSNQYKQRMIVEQNTQNNDQGISIWMCEYCGEKSYYDNQTKQCVKCLAYCVGCNEMGCEECITGMIKKESKCICPNDQSMHLINDQQSICLDNMDLNLNIVMNDNQYYLRFNFDMQLKYTDLTHVPLADFINLYFPEVQSSFYSFTDPQIIGNVFQLKLNVLVNFKANFGNVIIISNQYFVSQTNTHVLNEKYINKMMEFKVGPFLIQKDILQQPGLDDLNSQLNSFKGSNQDLFDFIRQIQFVFYLLNTLQPVSMFLLLNARFPPMLYKFYSLIGSFVFPFVPDYQSTNYKTSFSLFGYILDQQDSQQPKFGQFSQLGFCLSLFVNIPIIVIKYTVLILSLAVVDILQFSKSTTNPVLLKSRVFIIQKINSENEINISSVLLCIFIEFSTIEEQSYLYRLGFYFTIILIIMHFLLFYFNFTNIITQESLQTDYSAIFTQRMPKISFKQETDSSQQTSDMVKRSYFIIQLIKKFIYITIICLLYDYPYVVCGLSGVIFLSSSIFTLYAQPYLSKASRIIKFLGDFLLANVWFIHIGIIQLEKDLLQNTIIEISVLRKYIQLGKVILIILLTFNALFLLQVLIDVFLFIKKIFANKENKNNNERIYIKSKNIAKK